MIYEHRYIPNCKLRYVFCEGCYCKNDEISVYCAAWFLFTPDVFIISCRSCRLSLMIFFICWFPTDMLIFQHPPPPLSLPLFSFLSCTLQIWVRHPAHLLKQEDEGRRGALLWSHDCRTWFPQTADRRHFVTSITHKAAGRRGTCKTCVCVSVRCGKRTQAAQTVPADWDMLFSLSLSLSLPLLTSTSWFFFSGSSVSLCSSNRSLSALFYTYSQSPRTRETTDLNWPSVVCCHYRFIFLFGLASGS